MCPCFKGTNILVKGRRRLLFTLANFSVSLLQSDKIVFVRHTNQPFHLIMVELQYFSSEEKFRQQLQWSSHMLQLVPHTYPASYIRINATYAVNKWHKNKTLSRMAADYVLSSAFTVLSVIVIAFFSPQAVIDLGPPISSTTMLSAPSGACTAVLVLPLL